MARFLHRTRHADIPHGQSDENARMFSSLYQELCLLAAQRLAHNKLADTLSVQALVHELFLRFAHRKGHQWANRKHFLAASARAMGQIVIEQARSRKSLRRGGDVKISALEGIEVVDHASQPKQLLLRIDDALERLAAVDPLKARLVRLRFFVGLTELEVGRSLGIAERTVKWHWASAKAWLRQQFARPC